MCPVQLAADGPSRSAENSAASPMCGAADVLASSVRDYSCLALVYEGPVSAHPGTILRLATSDPRTCLVR